MLDHERRWWASGHNLIAGIDEAGRGPLAGPVVAAAVAVPPEICEELFLVSWKSLTDSKRLTDKLRRAFFSSITSLPAVIHGVGICTPAEIDEHNILNATHLAMRRAVEKLSTGPSFLLVDGLPVKGLPLKHEAIVGGDGKSLLIAAASIIAKVTRDDIMCELDSKYPGYGFARHKGYGTREHMEAIRRLGPCVEHRRSFAPVSQHELPFDA
ncbi:MAG TPA: ribonuclease HII [Kiritimatiellia bacterium]|nr:ribonuclease HII [Kiritimatiellia bacterium]